MTTKTDAAQPAATEPTIEWDATNPSAIGPLPELEPEPEPAPTGGTEIWAEIKRSSKYFSQGWKLSHRIPPGPNNWETTREGKPLRFLARFVDDGDEYLIAFNGNRYRLEDVSLFVHVGGKFIKIK